jgi:cytochrome c peroxidase
MFPVTGRDEMCGAPGDAGNELCAIADNDFTGIWRALMERLLALPGYRVLFAQAYPHVAEPHLGFQHAANAIAAFETAAFTRLDSPWDRYLAGDDDALGPFARRGAWLFFGKAGCASCHDGPLLTDQQFHNLAVPQLGPGKAPAVPRDFGHGGLTGALRDRFTFRTPPLRNVAATGPWMHNGSYTTLEGAVRHHLDPLGALFGYDRSQLPPDLQPTVLDDPATLRGLVANLDPKARHRVNLSDGEIAALLAFLEALTSPTLGQLEAVVPAVVPSGLPVDRPAR